MSCIFLQVVLNAFGVSKVGSSFFSEWVAADWNRLIHTVVTAVVTFPERAVS